MADTCESCRFYIPHKVINKEEQTFTIDEWGWCHGMPPKVTILVIPEHMVAAYGGWYETMTDDPVVSENRVGCSLWRATWKRGNTK